MSRIHFSVPAGHVALLEIDNPPMNALGREPRAELLARLDEIDAGYALPRRGAHGPRPCLLQRRRPEGTGRSEQGRQQRAFRRVRARAGAHRNLSPAGDSRR
ncbi:MAG: hypothetical protein WDM81_08300 [Rhizomicrobium sp.]